MRLKISRRGPGRRPAALLKILLFSSLSLLPGLTASAAQLTYGKYFGSIRMEGWNQSLAVSLDAFTTQIGDPTVFPEASVILRVNLGGFFSSEYVAYSFYSPTFNFEKGILQLDDPRNDLTATLQVRNEDSRTILEGTVIYRPTNARGRIRVVMDLDDSEKEAVAGAQGAPAPSLLSVLKGDYQGICGKTPADLELETGRGLGPDSPGNALAGYTITGRLGFADRKDCSDGGIGIPTAKYCNLYPLSSGIYYLYNRRLTLTGPLSILDCERHADTLHCDLRGAGRKASCTLSKRSPAPAPPAQVPPGIFLQVPAEKIEPLPPPLPPSNSELVDALNGDYQGFLHFERQDQYQLISMSVVATTSTRNMHVQNQVLISPTVSRYLGASWDNDAPFSTRFEQKVFYLSPGFALAASGNDDLLVIGDWRRGYLSGVWYSRSYGRVGTFELEKGVRPPIPGGMPLVWDLSGPFQGPLDGPAWAKDLWWLQLIVPGQIARPGQKDLKLLGQYRLRKAQSAVRPFDAAAYDLNSGTLSLLIRNREGDRIVSGIVTGRDELKLQWPVGPAMGAPMDAYLPLTYQRAPGPDARTHP